MEPGCYRRGPATPRTPGDLIDTIHASAVIGPDVEMGEHNVIGPFAVITGPVRLGDHNWIGPHAVIGTPAEISATDHGTDPIGAGLGAGVVIGSGNIIREHTVIHQGHYAITTIGNDCYLMNRVYVAHDVVLADGANLASGATLGGHVHVGRRATLGMGVVVHQHRLVGPGAMIGMGSVVTRDVPPCALAYGNPCRTRGANVRGLGRAGTAQSAIDALDEIYSAGRQPTGDEDAIARDDWIWWRSEARHRPV